MFIGTGFFAPATSIVFDPKRLIAWVAGDVRVIGFSLDHLEVVDCLFVRNEIVQQSAIAIWGDRVVLATGGELRVWQLGEDQTPEYSNLSAERYRSFIAPADVDRATIDWQKGRNSLPIGFEIALPTITAIATVGDTLAVASAEYEAIHLYNLHRNGSIVARFVGHVAGVTSLIPFALGPENKIGFLSGSADGSVRHWSIQSGSTEVSFLEHNDDVTAIAIGEAAGFTCMFTGGKDSIINAWDHSKSRWMFELSVGQGQYPVLLKFSSARNELFVVSVSLETPEGSAPEWNLQTYCFRPIQTPGT
jgi:WD40 repeat protein